MALSENLSEPKLSEQQSKSLMPPVDQALVPSPGNQDQAPQSGKATDLNLPQSSDFQGTESLTDPSLSNLPDIRQDEHHETESTDLPASVSNFCVPDTLQSKYHGTELTTEPADPSLSNLPEPPEEPLQSDCCGTGCSPCVFDIYEEDMKLWRELASLTPEERVARMQAPGQGQEGGGGACVALSPQEYRTFEVVGVQQVSSDSYIFTFGLAEDHVLGVRTGQHAVLR